MKHSQFWKNLEEVFGSAYGRSLASDLVLEPWYKCAQEAIGSRSGAAAGLGGAHRRHCSPCGAEVAPHVR